MIVAGVDARELSEQPAGKGNYLMSILVAMARHHQVRWTLYFQDGQPAAAIVAQLVKSANVPAEQVTYEIVPGSGLLWHRSVAKHAKKQDVFFAALSYFSSLWNKVPTVTVIHDIAVFKTHGFAHNKKAYFVERALLKRMVRKSAALVTVSEATATDVRELVPTSAEKLTVIPLAPALVDPSKKILALKERTGEILFVGTLEPRKNIVTLLQAYALLGPELRAKHPLILIGKQGWGKEDYKEKARLLGVKKDVHFLGYQNAGAIIDHYHRATVFAYPSLYEGFGLPVAEAMAAGTPVVTSTTPALVEVSGNAAFHCDPLSAEAIADALKKLLENSTTWNDMHEKALKRARQLTWEAAAEKTLTVLHQVLKGHR